MPIANWFSKPRWKHKDATLRAEAVSNGDHPELLQQLPEIALNDEAPMVRVAATRRLDNIDLLLKIAQSDPESRVQKAAWHTLEKHLLHASDENTRQWRDQLHRLQNPDLAKTLAKKADSREMRGLFQSKLHSPGDISDTLLSETDANLRLALAQRLEKPATLKRTLKQLGKKDPAVRTVLKQQLEKHDPESRQARLHEEALALCEQLESLIHGQNRPNTSEQRQQQLHTIRENWKKLQDKASQSPVVALPDALRTRFEGAYNTAAVMLDPARREDFMSQQRQQRTEQLLQEAEHWIKQAHAEPAKTTPTAQSGLQLQQRLQALDNENLTADQAARRASLRERLSESLQALELTPTTPHNESAEDRNHLAEQAQALLQSLHKTQQKSAIKSRDLARLRRQWDALLSQQATTDALKEFQEPFRRGMEQLVEKLEQQQRQRDEAAAAAVALIEKVDTAVKDGHLADAKQLFNQLVQKKKIAGTTHPLMRQNKHRIDRSWNALKELRQWQKWSNDKVRQDLIDELKAIPTSGWHPDAILAKLKETSARWKALEDQERLEGDRFPVRNSKMWKEFRTLQDALFELAQPYFAERAEHWNENLQRVQKKLASLESLQPENLDTRQLSTHVRDAVGWLKKLESLPPAERGKVAAQLREQINRLDKPLKAQYNEARARKQSLIEQSQGLLTHEDLHEAISQAKALQTKWKNAGYLPQSQERKLWKRFRAAQDAVFARLDAEKKQAQAEQEAARAAAQDFLSDIKTRAESAHSPEAIRTLLGELQSGWQTHRHSGLMRDYADLERTLREAAENFQRQQQTRSLQLLKQAGEICSRVEAGTLDAETAQQQWQNNITTKRNELGKAGHSPAWKAQQQRFEQGVQKLANTPNQTSSGTQQSPTDEYLTTLIAAEFLTGLETPPEYQEQRNAYQIDRLARRMSGENLPSSTTEARSLLETIYTLADVDAATRAAQQARQLRLEEALLKLLQNTP